MSAIRVFPVEYDVPRSSCLGRERHGGAARCYLVLGSWASSWLPGPQSERPAVEIWGGVDLVMVMDSFGGGVVGGRIAGGGVLSLAQGLGGGEI